MLIGHRSQLPGPELSQESPHRHAPNITPPFGQPYHFSLKQVVILKNIQILPQLFIMPPHSLPLFSPSTIIHR